MLWKGKRHGRCTRKHAQKNHTILSIWSASAIIAHFDQLFYMKLRLLAKKYYFKTTAKTRFDTEFDYDTSGELNADMYLKHEPCFAHTTVKEDLGFERKVIIYNGSPPPHRYLKDWHVYLKFGFLSYFILDGNLVPVINGNEPYLDKTEAVSTEDLHILLKRHSLKLNEVLVVERMGESLFNDTLLDSYTLGTIPGYANRKGYVYTYIAEADKQIPYIFFDRSQEKYIQKSTNQVVAYSMLGPYGSQIKQLTDLPAALYPDLLPSELANDLYTFMLHKGHIEDVDTETGRNELVQDFEGYKISVAELVSINPDTEVLILGSFSTEADLPPFSLPKLRNLVIKYREIKGQHRMLPGNLQTLIDASPNLIRCKIDNAVSPNMMSCHGLKLGAKLKLLTVSVEVLPYIQFPKNNALVALEITPYFSSDSYYSRYRNIYPEDLERVILACPHLEVLYIPQVNFSSLPRHLPSHIRIEYSQDTKDKLQLQELISAEAQKKSLADITKTTLISKLKTYLRLKMRNEEGLDTHFYLFEHHSDNALAWCFSYLKDSRRADGMYLAWESFVTSIGTWNEMQLPAPDTVVSRSLAHLWMGMHTCLFSKSTGYPSIKGAFTYSKAVFSLEPLWSSPPYLGLLFCNDTQSVYLRYSYGYWCYFDPNESLVSFHIISRGEESRIQTLLEQRFGGVALEVKTQAFLDTDLNPSPSSKKVVDYMKAGGLLTLARIKKDESFSYLNINTLSVEDLSPLFEKKYQQLEAYKTAYLYRPKVIRHMLERYQSLRPHFEIPELDAPDFVPNESPSSPSPLLTLKPETTNELLISQNRALTQHRTVVRSSGLALSEEWYDADSWFQRPTATDFSQRMLLDKLQDYIVVKEGMNQTTWQLLNTLETGIEQAIAYCIADFWSDKTITDPHHLLFGWKDTLTALQYCPAADTRSSLLLQTLWFYTYSTHFTKLSIDSYRHQQKVSHSDLPDLLAQYPEQALILTNVDLALTLLYREGIWYLFDVQDATGEPQYFRCGDESALQQAIAHIFPDTVTLITREAISVKGAITQRMLPKNKSYLAGYSLFSSLPFCPENIAYVVSSASVSHQDEDSTQSLFNATPLINTRQCIAVSDRNAAILSHCSVDSYSELPKRPTGAVPATIQLDDDLNLDELDDDLLSREGENILVQFSTQNHLDLYLEHILTTSQAKKRGVWIVNSMRDLQCAAASLLIHEDNHCEEVPAPAGDFYQALQTYPELLIAINLSEFTFKEIVQINPIWDAIRSNDNVPIPKKALVLSLQNIGDPHAYKGDDLISRQDEKPVEIPACLPIPPILEFGVTPSAIPVTNNVEIDFYNSVHWQKYLYGTLSPVIGGMSFKPSLLMKKSFEGSLNITFRNAPLGLPAFRQAVYNLLHQHRLQYYGREVILPSSLHIDYVEGYVFLLAPCVPAFTRQYSPNYDKVLNPSSVMDLFVQYQFPSEGMISKPGVIEAFAGCELTLYVTRTVSHEVWSQLLHEAQEFHCRLLCILAETVQLPDELMALSTASLPFTSEIPHPTVKEVMSIEGYDLVISVEGLTAQDLFYRRYQDQSGILREKLCDMWQFLLEEEAGRVLLVGNCSEKLQDQLWDVMNGKGYFHNGQYERPLGTMEFLSPKVDKALLAKRPVRQHAIPNTLPEDSVDTSEDFSLSIVNEFDLERTQDMSHALISSRLVCLLGNTGVGKSHFMQTYPGVIFDDIEKWIEQGGILFLDEANLKNIKWERFESVMWDPPTMLHKGIYHSLTDQHKIVVAMNPSNYSKERQTPELFHTYAHVVVFSSFPNAYLYHEMVLPILGECQGQALLLGRVFIQVYQIVKSLDDNAFSVRELQMMAYAFKATPHLFTDDDHACALYHAYHTAMRALPKNKTGLFHSLFVQKWRHIPDPSRVYPPNLQGENERFEIISIHYPAYAALDDFMAVRDYRKVKGGLSGFVLEGEPGTGKSQFLKLYLISKGFKEGEDFYYIPAKWSPTRKKEHLLRAFHAGKIALMEELNASNMIEETLNAVLSGVDLAGKKATVPGFALLGTQNDSEMGGRNELSVALQRRMVHVHFPSYTLAQMFQVLLKQEMPLTIAYDAVMRSVADPSLGFRSIYKDAKFNRDLPNYPITTVSISLPDVFWHVIKLFHPLSVADGVLLKSIHNKGWERVFYQAANSEYYFHNTVYRHLKKQYRNLQSLRIRLEDNASTVLRTVFHYLDKPRIKITETVFAHLEIDMEMPGLAGLQGESEENIFGCFSQYLADRSLTDTRVLNFSRAVDALLLHCQVMRSLSEKNSRQGIATYCQETAQQIQLAQLGQDYFFAGGWRNLPPGSSHSMIYRLERTEPGFRFYIYNAGAGLAEHEVISGEFSDLYYPVKVYDIPDPVNEKELSYLLQRLLLPNLVAHPARTQEHEIVDATTLYRNIEKSLAHMSAKQVLAKDLLQQGVVTQGVMAGACTLSVQQLLNCFLDDPVLYRCLMLDMKLYVLKEFINEYPAPRPAYINRLLILAIENNLKILLRIQKEHPADLQKMLDPLTAAHYLRTTKQQISDEAWLSDPNETDWVHDFAEYKIDWIPDVTTLQPKVSKKADPLEELIRVENEILSLDSVTNPMHFLSTWLLFEGNSSFKSLELLQARYQKLYTECYGDIQLPRMFLIQLTLLHACAKRMPDFKDCFDKELGAFVAGYENCPYLATYDLNLDLKLRQIMTAYSYQTLDYDSYFLNRFAHILGTSDPQYTLILEKLYIEKYGHNHQPLHLAVRDEHVQALYALLEELDEDGQLKSHTQLDIPFFRPLIERIQLQMRVETFMVRSFRFLLNQPLSGFAKPKIIYQKNRLKMMTPLSQVSPNTRYFCRGNTALDHHKFVMPHSAEREALLAELPSGRIWAARNKESPSENDIQLADNTSVQRSDAVDCFIRELSHLRLCPEHQIIVTLDYFLGEISHVSSATTQLYIEANVFQPGLLAIYYNDPALIKKWDEFIHAALNECRDVHGEISHASLFFLRLQFYFNRYFAYTTRLRKNVKDLQVLIDQQSHKDLLSTLHHCKFMTILAINDPALLPSAYESYVYIQAMGNLSMEQDSASEDDLRRAQLHYKQWLRTAEISPKQWMDNVLKKYPWLSATIDKVDVIAGKLYYQAFSLSPTPVYLKNLPILRRLGLRNDMVCMLSFDEQIIEFGAPNPFLRALKFNDRWVFQKKWEHRSQHEWYELCPLSSRQVQCFGLDKEERGYPLIKHALPVWLTDENTEAWVHTQDKNTVLFVQNNSICYEWISNEQKLRYIRHASESADLVALPERHQGALLHFEEAQNIVHYAYADHHIIHYPRYGLDLHYDDQQDAIFHPASQTKLADQSTSPFASNVACLTFEKNNQPVLCLVPNQAFYVLTHEVQTIGHYYPLIHDISCHLPMAYLNHVWHKQGIAEKDRPLWHFADSETYYQFRIVDGKPQADTAEEALHLCYIYLATHDLPQAWRVLKELHRKGGISGTAKELLHLEAIMNKLPASEVPTEYSEERMKRESLCSPRYIACKLKALSLLTRCIQQGKVPVLATITTKAGHSANEEYAAFQAESIQNFYKHLPALIARLFTQFLQSQRYLSQAFELGEDTCQSLLTYIDEAGSVARGPLGIARLQLNLKHLLKLEHNLLALKQGSGTQWSFHDERRLKRIQTALQTQMQVSKKITRLEYVDIDLTLPNFFNEHMLRNNPQCAMLRYKDLLAPSVCSEAEAIDMLSSMITAEDLLINLPTLLRIAREKDTAPPFQGYRKRLLHFCQATLRSARYVSLKDQATPVPYIANVLYRLLNNPSFWDTERISKWDDLIANIATLPVRPIQVLQACDVYADVLATATELVAELRTKLFRHDPIVSKPISVAEWTITLDWEQSYRQLSAYSKNGSEHAVGKAIYHHMQEKKRVAQHYLQDATTRDNLREQAERHQSELGVLLRAKWAEIECLAHSEPENMSHKEAHLNAISAAQRELVNKEALLKLYLHQNRGAYYAETALTNEADVDRLHAMLHEYVSLAVQNQKMGRVLQALEGEDYLEMAEALFQENSNTVQCDPALMLFQYLENKMIRPLQMAALHRLLESLPNGGFREMVEKILMGGGKSKLVLPILAQKKANGTNLVVVEVQRALLKTQHRDMNHLSQALFNQTGHLFEFNRDSECSAARLKQIYQLFECISVNKDYLMTTGESMQSLHLKYRELLRARPKLEKDLPEWHQQIIWAEKIVTFLKSSGDAILDEVQEGLRHNKKINYTFGPALPIDAKTIDYSLQLYQLIERYPHCQDDGARLIDFLFMSRWSPLITMVPSNLHEIAKQYLRNDCDRIPPEIQALDRETRNALAFYKEQVLLLPKTAALKYKEKYGPSKQYKKNPAEQAISLPYKANNTPNERSRFGHVLKMINCTIQGLLQQGVEERLLCYAIQQWQAQARKMMQDNPSLYPQMDGTPLAQTINEHLRGTGLTLQTIHIQRAEDRALLNQKSHYKPLIYRILKDFVLPCIPQEQSVLHGDSYDHVDLYRSCQGLSGTPGNHKTFKRMHFDEQSALGNDGYLQEVLKEKITSLRAQDFQSLPLFIQALQPDEPKHALIDICARFAGYDAIEVASALAQHFAQHRQAIKYVLYFNDDDMLCALPVNAQDKPVILGTTDQDEICRKLGACSLEACYAYYDQERTLGLDLTHIPKAQAQVLVDKNTHLQAILQGCTRMRGLEKQQTLEIIGTSDMQAISVTDLLQKSGELEAQHAQEDNAAASFDKLENLIRLDLEQRILNINERDVDRKHRYMLAFERFFFNHAEQQDLFDKYGAIYQKEVTQTILRRHQGRLLQEWRKCLDDVRETPTISEANHITFQMNKIIAEARDHCPEKILNRVGKKQFDEEVEAEKELELDLEKLDEYYDANLSATPHCSWDPNEARPLSAWMGLRPRFGDNLLYSPNFAQVYQEQNMASLDRYAKPVHLIYFVKYRNKVTACLVTQEEAREIRAANPEGQWWLTTTRHSRLGGHPPEGIEEDAHYQSLIEQIRYFKGELNAIVDTRKPCVWLNNAPKEKLDFYAQRILPNREANYVRHDALDILTTQGEVQEPVSILGQVASVFTSFFSI